MPDADNSLPPGGQTLSQALKALVTVLEARSIRYAIIGGVAAIQHARVRTTDDIDALLSVTQVAMPALFEALQSTGFTVDPLRNIAELRGDGLTTIRFGDVLVDLMRPLLPVYAHILDRVVHVDILDQKVPVSSVEGLIVMKLIAFRPQDESDIKDLLAAYGNRLDLNYILAEFATVAAKNDPRLAKFQSWLVGR